MKYIRIISVLLTVVFAILSFTNILNDDISMPLMMFFLGTTNFIMAKDNFKIEQKTTAYLNLIAGYVVFLIIIVVVFI